MATATPITEYNSHIIIRHVQLCFSPLFHLQDSSQDCASGQELAIVSATAFESKQWPIQCKESVCER